MPALLIFLFYTSEVITSCCLSYLDHVGEKLEMIIGSANITCRDILRQIWKVFDGETMEFDYCSRLKTYCTLGDLSFVDKFHLYILVKFCSHRLMKLVEGAHASNCSAAVMPNKCNSCLVQHRRHRPHLRIAMLLQLWRNNAHNWKSSSKILPNLLLYPLHPRKKQFALHER